MFVFLKCVAFIFPIGTKYFYYLFSFWVAEYHEYQFNFSCYYLIISGMPELLRADPEKKGWKWKCFGNHNLRWLLYLKSYSKSVWKSITSEPDIRYSNMQRICTFGTGNPSNSVSFTLCLGSAIKTILLYRWISWITAFV